MAGIRWTYLLVLVTCITFCIANGVWLSWVLLLAVLALPWLSLLVSLYGMVCTRITLLAPRHVQIGAKADAMADVQTKGLKMPTDLRLRVTRPLTGEQFFLRPGDSLPTEHCGGLVIESKRARYFDLLGLWRRTLRNIRPTTLFVLPPPVQEDLSQSLEQQLAVSWRPKPGGGFSEQHEMREYRPGDNLNQIHWKLSAKTGDLIIREPMEPLGNQLLLTMNLSGSPTLLDQKLGRLRWLGDHLLSHNLPFSLWVHTGAGTLEFSVTTPEGMQECLETLLCTPKATDGTILSRSAWVPLRHHIGGAADER